MNEAVIAERRSDSHSLIDHLVMDRTSMLALYADLAAAHPFENIESVSDLLEKFCEALVDYTADGHFRLYRFLDEKKERRQEVLDVANKVYDRILETTQTVLDFNDRYDGADHPLVISSLEADLSRLGEDLAERIELEDQIIHAMNRRR